MKKILVELAILFLIGHTIRDLMQVFGFNNFFTNIFHESGVKLSNVFWGIWGLSYEIWSEWLLISIEIVLIMWLVKVRKKFRK